MTVVGGTLGVTWGEGSRSTTSTRKSGLGVVLLSPLMALESFFMEFLMLVLSASCTRWSTFLV